MKKRILVVEDEFQISEMIQEYLTENNFLVEVQTNGIDALESFIKRKHDLIITDVMMDKMDGFKLVEKIRVTSQVPVLVLTALTEEYDEIKGFNLGVNDYMKKPFSLPVLLARVNALLNNDDTKKIFVDGKLTIDSKRRVVEYDGELCILTKKEFEILVLLTSEVGRVFTREQIVDHIWGFDFDKDIRVIDTHIKNVRRKLPSIYISTISGIGYRYGE